MPVRNLIADDLTLLGSATVSHNADTPTTLDFGTPNDLYLPATGYTPHDRVLVVFTAVTSGSTDTVSFAVLDAPDDAGSIGTPAAAETDGTLSGGTGSQVAWTSVQLKAGRPWLRCTVDASGDNDTFVVSCVVFAVPASM